MKKILVSVDGSDNSNRALLEAKMMGQCTGADVDILNVIKYQKVRPFISLNDESIQSMDDLKILGEKILNDAEKLFDDFPGNVNLKLRTGNPADVIMKEAKEGDYDLIVMGNRGLGTFSRTLMGSVSSKVLNHSNRNILIVK